MFFFYGFPENNPQRWGFELKPSFPAAEVACLKRRCDSVLHASAELGFPIVDAGRRFITFSGVYIGLPHLRVAHDALLDFKYLRRSSGTSGLRVACHQKHQPDRQGRMADRNVLTNSHP